jgi:hypothetical protein
MLSAPTSPYFKVLINIRVKMKPLQVHLRTYLIHQNELDLKIDGSILKIINFKI